MAKKNVSARLDETMVSHLEKLAEVTGKNLTDLITEAIAQYLNLDVPTVGDRIEALERELAEVRGRLQMLGTLSHGSVKVLQPSQLK